MGVAAGDSRRASRARRTSWQAMNSASGGEGELQDALGDVVGDADADQDAERREHADHERLAQARRCRSRSGGSAPTRATMTIISSEVDSRLDLGEAEEDRQRRDEEDAAADPDQAAGEAAGEGEQDGSSSFIRGSPAHRDRDQRAAREEVARRPAGRSAAGSRCRARRRRRRGSPAAGR